VLRPEFFLFFIMPQRELSVRCAHGTVSGMDPRVNEVKAYIKEHPSFDSFVRIVKDEAGTSHVELRGKFPTNS